MKCQSCGKKEATVRYSENINGNKQELYFCKDCAQKIGFVDFTSIFSPLFITIPESIQQDEVSCNICGYTLENYSKTGMLGCPNCYDTFCDELDEILLKVHGKTNHVKLSNNKITIDNNLKKKTSKSESIEELKIKIKELIANEEYEQAAIIRDKIRKIEGK